MTGEAEHGDGSEDVARFLPDPSLFEQRARALGLAIQLIGADQAGLGLAALFKLSDDFLDYLQR